MMMAPKLTLLLFFITAAFEIGLIDALRPDYTYVKSTNGFYKFHRTDATWADARSICQSEGAVLFHPENEQEYKQVMSVLQVGHNDGWFLHAGFSDLAKIKEYVTVDGRPLSQVFHEWYDGQLGYGSSEQSRCGRLTAKSFVLEVGGCSSTTLRFICKQLSSIETAMMTAVEDLKTSIANQTAALEKIASIASTILAIDL